MRVGFVPVSQLGDNESVSTLSITTNTVTCQLFEPGLSAVCESQNLNQFPDVLFWGEVVDLLSNALEPQEPLPVILIQLVARNSLQGSDNVVLLSAYVPRP